MGRDDAFPADAEPWGLFAAWMAEAVAAEPNDPDAMALATVDRAGLPDVRIVLMKGYDSRGFVFYTNLESAKGQELLHTRVAALLFHWKSLRRQVRVRGVVDLVTPKEADAYFASRARQSRIGAWASRQSRPLASRAELEAEVAAARARFGAGEVPRPAHWSGFRLAPLGIEFWREGAHRLHDRLAFTRQRAGPDEPWTRTLLQP